MNPLVEYFWHKFLTTEHGIPWMLALWEMGYETYGFEVGQEENFRHCCKAPNGIMVTEKKIWNEPILVDNEEYPGFWSTERLYKVS